MSAWFAAALVCAGIWSSFVEPTMPVFGALQFFMAGFNLALWVGETGRRRGVW